MNAAYRATATMMYDNGYNIDRTNYIEVSVFSRWIFHTTATRLWCKVVCDLYGSFPGYSKVGVVIDGAYTATFTCTAAGINTFTLDLAVGTKTVELITGLVDNGTGTHLGTWLFAAYLSGGVRVIEAAPSAANRLVIYGDSIAVGAAATTPVQSGWPILVRDDYDGSTMLEAWGARSLNDNCATAGARTTFAALLAAYNPARVWLAIGTNDYGLDKWSAADFGTAYADLLDKLHVALPSATAYCQTPIERTDESANGFGDTLGDYRTQINTAVSTRGPWAILVDGTGAAFPQAPGDLADGLHPTTAGHAKYRTAVEAELGI